MLSWLSGLSGLFSFLTGLLNLFSMQRERQAGADQANLAAERGATDAISDAMAAGNNADTSRLRDDGHARD
jgi:hypothetical protein